MGKQGYLLDICLNISFKIKLHLFFLFYLIRFQFCFLVAVFLLIWGLRTRTVAKQPDTATIAMFYKTWGLQQNGCASKLFFNENIMKKAFENIMPKPSQDV